MVGDTRDIVPGLLEKIQREFNRAIKSSKKLSEANRRVSEGTADYITVNDAAIEIGECLAASLKTNVTASELPDGKMYYNIAERVLTQTLGKNHEMVSKIAKTVQTNLNHASGIGVQGIAPKLKKNKVKGMINKLASYEKYEDAAWLLEEPVVNFTQSIVDDAIRENAEFQAKSDIETKIERTTTGKCCEWCSNLAGTYTYPNVPEDVYRRHRYCKCKTTFTPGNGKKEDVWRKKWKDPKETEKIEERKRFGNGGS